MEAEYVDFGTSCHKLFPLISITKELCSTYILQLQENANMHINIHEDNAGHVAVGNWSHVK